MQAVVDFLNEWLTWLLVVVLPCAGIYFTIVTRGVQFRHLGNMWRIIFSSRGNAGAGGISSFQAFAMSLASRVGTGNIVGVAIALTLGGPGAIFWMWVMAMLGMATACVEATLAQLFKVPHNDGTFRGGPAYYIQRGLKSRVFGTFFAAIFIFTFGFSFNGVQANTIADVTSSTWGLDKFNVAIGLTVLTAVIIFGGIKQVAKVTEWLAPMMALLYVLLAIAVLLVRITDVPGAIGSIIAGAFGFDQALYGTMGGIIAAVLNGVKRGMYSNEAGMGSAPNARRSRYHQPPSSPGPHPVGRCLRRHHHRLHRHRPDDHPGRTVGLRTRCHPEILRRHPHPSGSGLRAGLLGRPGDGSADLRLRLLHHPG